MYLSTLCKYEGMLRKNNLQLSLKINLMVVLVAESEINNHQAQIGVRKPIGYPPHWEVNVCTRIVV